MLVPCRISNLLVISQIHIRLIPQPPSEISTRVDCRVHTLGYLPVDAPKRIFCLCSGESISVSCLSDLSGYVSNANATISACWSPQSPYHQKSAPASSLWDFLIQVARSTSECTRFSFRFLLPCVNPMIGGTWSPASSDSTGESTRPEPAKAWRVSQSKHSLSQSCWRISSNISSHWPNCLLSASSQLTTFWYLDIFCHLHTRGHIVISCHINMKGARSRTCSLSTLLWKIVSDSILVRFLLCLWHFCCLPHSSYLGVKLLQENVLEDVRK